MRFLRLLCFLFVFKFQRKRGKGETDIGEAVVFKFSIILLFINID